MTSDSEEDLPSHLLDWLRAGSGNKPDATPSTCSKRTATGNVEDGLSPYSMPTAPSSLNDAECTDNKHVCEELNVEEILARRKRDEELQAKLEEVLKMEYHPKPNTSKSSINDDGDLKYFIEKAKEMQVLDSTVTDSPMCTSMNTELSCLIFNLETLNIANFVAPNISRHLPTVFKGESDDVFKITLLRTVVCSAKEEKNICTFFFYLMSVHPSVYIREACYDFLTSKSKFQPHFTDFINVFRNWGVKLDEIYTCVPDMYIGVHSSLKVRPEESTQVSEQNLLIVFKYMEYVMQLHSPSTYSLLVEPLIRLIFNERIYRTTLRQILADIIVYFSKLKDVSLQDLHLKDLSLQNQTILYTRIIRHAPSSVCLAYATLQQFLGSANIMYSKSIDFEAMHSFLYKNSGSILNSSFLHISFYLRLLDHIFFQQLFAERNDTKNLNFQNWNNLFRDWSRYIIFSDRTADPMILKEQLAQSLYELRMELAVNMKCQYDNSIFS